MTFLHFPKSSSVPTPIVVTGASRVEVAVGATPGQITQRKKCVFPSLILPKPASYERTKWPTPE